MHDVNGKKGITIWYEKWANRIEKDEIERKKQQEQQPH